MGKKGRMMFAAFVVLIFAMSVFSMDVHASESDGSRLVEAVAGESDVVVDMAAVCNHVYRVSFTSIHVPYDSTKHTTKESAVYECAYCHHTYSVLQDTYTAPHIEQSEPVFYHEEVNGNIHDRYYNLIYCICGFQREEWVYAGPCCCFYSVETEGQSNMN